MARRQEGPYRAKQYFNLYVVCRYFVSSEKKTIQELDEKILEVSHRLHLLNRELLVLKEDRACKAHAMVMEFMPALTPTVLVRLRQNFPTFLTPARHEAFLFNQLRFGFFKPKSYNSVLSLLQLQFTQYLENAGLFNGQDYLITAHSLMKARMSNILKMLGQDRKLLLSDAGITVTELDIIAEPGVPHGNPVDIVMA